MTGTLKERRSQALSTARAVKASRQRDKEDRDTITERCVALAVRQFECDPAEVEVHFHGDSAMQPLVFVPTAKGVKIAHEVVD